MKIDRVKLKPIEQALLKKIKFDMETNYDYETVRESFSAAAELTRLLFDRDAIPEVRIRSFFKSRHHKHHGQDRERIRKGMSGHWTD